MLKSVVVVLALALLAGCADDAAPVSEAPLRGGDHSGSPSAPTDAESNQRTVPPPSDPSVTTPNDGESASVELIDPGSEPRRQLRIRPQVGATQRMTMLVDIHQVIDMGGYTIDNSMPIYEMDHVNTVTSVDDDEIRVEQAPYEFRIVDDRGLDPAVLTEIERVLDLMLDLGTVTFTVDDRARITDQTAMGEAAMYDLGGLDSASVASDVSIPLPEEPIGVGGRWRVTSQATVNGIRTDTVTDLELVELDDTRAVANHVQSLTMPPGFIEGSFDRDEILDGTHQSSGTITWHLDHALPLVSQSGTGTTRMRTFQGSSSTTLTTNEQISTTMTLRP